MDTDDTLVDPVEPLPVNRKLFLEDPVLPEHAVDLVTPKKEHVDEEPVRPVAAPCRTSHMKALKQTLAENAKRKLEKKADAARAAPAVVAGPEEVRNTAVEAAATGEHAGKGTGSDAVFTRRNQLELKPAPKAKGKAKAATAKTKAADEAKINPADDAKIDPADDAKIDPADDAALAPKLKAAGKAKPGTKKAPKAKAAPAASEVQEPQAKRRLLGRSRAPPDMEPREVMDILHEPGNETIFDVVMQMVEAMKSKGDPPSIDKPGAMPEFKYWDLSKYWTRNSLGVLFKAPGRSPVYCGTFSAARSENMWVAIEAVSAFAPRSSFYGISFMLPKLTVALHVLMALTLWQVQLMHYVCVYIHTCIYVYIYALTFSNLFVDRPRYIQGYGYIYTYNYIVMYIHTYAYVQICMHLYS